MTEYQYERPEYISILDWNNMSPLEKQTHIIGDLWHKASMNNLAKIIDGTYVPPKPPGITLIKFKGEVRIEGDDSLSKYNHLIDTLKRKYEINVTETTEITISNPEEKQ